ncbi:DUF599 domain-containing protein [Pseudohalocynthiibacter aestuariivivens]|uniref:DUF599 domain-containing protein n=1 Tax=Roseovarius pelagicus TaxID=2980108 RepID=A0ABY6DG65_9RHOB|nr:MULTISPECIES: DUF599 domain-containing protein [Rhodobacterales]QIE47585.1 DUF599 domain-containing protein [Pseudohalocynthiibacter aestuariivivens]UXX85137.1 DUF599 domain-containing protein [Roseovarius pelagicus]
MHWVDRLALFGFLDIMALATILVGSFAIGLIIEHSGRAWPSVSRLMADYRRHWMTQMIHRDPRIFDAQTLTNLRQGATFFASATMIALGGGLALLGNTDTLIGIASDLTIDQDPAIVWEIKLFVMLGFLVNAFFKFVWANRLFGYCAVVMAAVPNDPDDPLTSPRAHKAAELNITGARSFNRGLRSIYFALASTAWLLGPEALIVAAALTCLILFRREFASQSRRILMQPEATGKHDTANTQT